jgi:hypothetical protein
MRPRGVQVHAALPPWVNGAGAPTRAASPHHPAAPQVKEEATGETIGREQAAGCGGFGKGNFSELFKRIEDYERTLNV